MNEISSLSLPGPGHNNPPAPPKSPRGEIHFSDPCNAMVSALAKASLEFENPVKNKTVTVNSRRTGSAYSYKYATLDVLLDCVRRPLARQDLIFVSLLYDNRLTATIMHGASGQWMASSMTLAPPDPGKESIAGENTYWRRQLLQSLTSLAAEDDDDGAAAAGNDRTYVEHPPRGNWRAELNATPDVIDEHDLATLARSATDGHVEGGLRLLHEWVAQQGRVAQLRTRDEAAWNTLIDAVGAGLNRSLGGTIAAAWKWFARASTREHEKAGRAKVYGEWDTVLQRFKTDCLDGYKDLMRHMNACGEAIERAASQPPPAVDREPPPAEKTFAEYVVGADGEVQSDEIDDPTVWAKAYVNVWNATDWDLHSALKHANAGALARANCYPAASAILADPYAGEHALANGTMPGDSCLRLTTAEALVTMPLTRTGTSHLAGYITAVKAALDTQVGSEADLAVWEAANHKTIAELPHTGKARVALLVSERRRALGVTT